MKRVRSSIKYLLILSGLFLLFITSDIARVNNNKGGKSAEPRQVLTATNPSETPMDINNITSWLRGDGYHDPIVSLSWNGTFPKGTAGFIYAEGIFWGGKVDDGVTPVVRVAGNGYASSCRAGRILTDASGNVTGREPDDPNTLRPYKVRRDWSTADLTDDAAAFYLVPSPSVTQSQKQDVRDQYLVDWVNWPASKGAPYDDRNGNGVYDPDPNGRLQSANGDTLFDIPGFPGADQTMWIVYNDLDPGRAAQDYGSPPIGLEVQETDWAYAATNSLGNMIFKKSKIIYKGTVSTPRTATIDSMFIVQWSDPDDGQYSDDFAGCDTILSLGYVYNSSSHDAIYTDQFGLAPPAGGFDFLQGPIVRGTPQDSAIFDLKVIHGYKNLPMTTFTYFAAGSQRDDPDRGGAYSGTLQWYNLMRGCEPRPQYPAGVPLYDQFGNVTHFELTGDPVLGAGDLDGKPTLANPNRLPPGDRRIVLSSGPFTMARGDTQEVVTALVGGLGLNYLSSVSVLKYNVGFARFAYNNFFVLPSPPTQPDVTVDSLHQGVVLDWGLNLAAVTNTENTVHSGFAFEGYNIYQLPSSNSRLQEGVRIATYDVKNLTSIISDYVFDEASGFVISKPVQFGSNSGVQRFIRITTDAIRGGPLVDGQSYYFAVTAYSFNPNLPLTAPFHQLESSPVVVTAVPHSDNPGERYQTTYGDTVMVIHTSGTSDATIAPIVLDPAKVKSDSLLLTFAGDKKNKTYTIRNLVSGDTLFTGGTNLGPLFAGTTYDYPIINGMMISVADVAFGMNDAKTVWVGDTEWVEGGGRFADPHAVFNGGILPGIYGSTFLGHYGPVFPADESYPIEIRFSATTVQKAYRLERNGPGGSYVVQSTNGFTDVPFTVWDVSVPGSPRQLTVAWRDNNDDGVWDPGVQDDGVEIIFIYNKTYNPAGGQFDNTADNATSGSNADIAYDCSFDVRPGHTLSEADGKLVVGVNIRLDANDQYVIKPPKGKTSSVALAQADVQKINVFPNPYYGFNLREQTRINKYVTFNHLPARATIRIFNLAGVLVRVIEKDDPQQFAQWDLRNDNQLPVASGIYIVFVDMPEIGATKVLKLALVQEEQILRVY